MHDIQWVEDQGELMASQAPIDANKTAPILRKMQEDQKLNMGNSVEMNLQLYDQYQSL